MLDPQERSSTLSPGFRWAIWAVFVITWTVGLLVPFSIETTPGSDEARSLHFTAKALHITAYAVQTILSAWLRLPGYRRWLLLLFNSLHAFGSEIGQSFVPTRTMSLTDVGFDHIGIALGFLLSLKWWLKPR